MSTRALVLLLLCVIASSAHSQQSTRSAADLQQLLEHSTSRLESRNARLEELRADVLMLDKRIERRVEKIVGMLSNIKDSTESNSVIVQQKRTAVDGLMNAVKAYQAKRNELLTELAQSKNEQDREGLKKGMDALDLRIENRINNIAQISTSLARSPGFKEYERKHSTNRSEKNKHADRVGRTGETIRRELADIIKDSMGRIEQENASYRRHLESDHLSTENRELIRKLIEENEVLIAQREDQLVSAMTETTKAKPVGRVEAHTMRKLVDETAADLGQEITRLLWLIDRIIEERKTINSIEITIEQLKAEIKAISE